MFWANIYQKYLVWPETVSTHHLICKFLPPYIFLNDCSYFIIRLNYISFQVFELSGILTVFFCGIVMSHYAWHNVTHSSQVTTTCVTNSKLCLKSYSLNSYELKIFTSFVWIAVMLLQQCHILPKCSSSSMLEWTHWMLKNGGL